MSLITLEDQTSSTDGGGKISTFSYEKAFSRNLGWVTEEEQDVLRQKRVAIAGMGGVGGVNIVTLARLGVGKFKVADFDTFDYANFNRQIGATLSTVGKGKADVLTGMVHEINPECDISIFREGLTELNVDRFLDGTDLFIDSLDFFAFGARELAFRECQKRKIPTVTAAPLGMGAASIVTVPDGMPFEDYFRLSGLPEIEKAIRFLIGLAPRALQRHYLADISRVNLLNREGPSTSMACQLCSGVVGTESLKLLLGRGQVWPLPFAHQFDAYRNRAVKTWRPGGNGHPLNKLTIRIVKKKLGLI